MIPAFEARTVQKGRQLSSVEAVRDRLKKIKSNKQGSYYKALMDGNIAVMKSKHKTYSGGPKIQYDLVEIIPMDNIGDAFCGNCESEYFDLDGDYLCSECRKQISE